MVQRFQFIGIACILLRAAPAQADSLTFSAKKAEIDPQSQSVVLERDVHLHYHRFHLQSDFLRLHKQSDHLIELTGESILSFCPCEDAPLQLAFSGAKLFPEGDLTLRFPRLLLFGLPVFALPWLWIRSPEQVGALPPQLAFRGRDGLYAATGLKWPLFQSPEGRTVLEINTGVYFKGGLELGLRFSSPSSENRMAWDFYRNGRLWADGRGRLPIQQNIPSIVWDFDFIRGERALERTADVDAILKPFDQIHLDSILWAGSPGVLVTGLEARASRGDGPIFWGPRAHLHLGGDVAQRGIWDGLLEARLGALDGSGQAVSMLRAGVFGEVSARPGPFLAAFNARGRLWANSPVHTQSNEPAFSRDALGLARFRLGLPLAREFPSASGLPWIHEVHPFLDGVFVASERGGNPLSMDVHSSGLGSQGAALFGMGLESGLGRYGGSQMRAFGEAGWMGNAWGDSPHAHLVLLSGLQAQWTWAAAKAELALTRPVYGDVQVQHAFFAKLRVGPVDSVNLRVEGYGQSSENVRKARFLGESPMLGEFSFLAGPGVGGAARMWIPWTRSWSTWMRGAAELSEPRGLFISGGVLGQHPCGCAALTLSGAYRKGREGVDLMLLVDLLPRDQSSLN